VRGSIPRPPAKQLRADSCLRRVLRTARWFPVSTDRWICPVAATGAGQSKVANDTSGPKRCGRCTWFLPRRAGLDSLRSHPSRVSRIRLSQLAHGGRRKSGNQRQ